MRTRTELNTVLPFARNSARMPGLRIGPVGLLVRIASQDVSRAAPGVEQGLRGSNIDFSAQAVYVNFDEIREGIEIFVPNVFGNFRAANDTTRVARQELNQRVLFGSYRNWPARTNHRLRGGIQHKIRNRELQRAEFARTTRQGA